MQLDRVSVHGPTLAVLLQSVLTGERCCDGLLFGSVTSTRSVKAEDAQGAAAGAAKDVQSWPPRICC